MHTDKSRYLPCGGGVLALVQEGAQPESTLACLPAAPLPERARLRRAPREASKARTPWTCGN